MEADFWLQRWQNQQTAFDQAAAHPLLQRHWDALGCAPGAQVLVPLCGRSLDMDWLLARGHTVLGVELSPLAAEAWFGAHALEPLRTADGAFTRLQAAGCAILVGDFFALEPRHVAQVVAWYDRAALVALPLPMRQRYVALLAQLLAPATRGLLVSMDYPPEQITPPPFSVPAPDLQRLLAGAYTAELLERVDTFAQEPRLAARGLRSMHEEAWLLRRA
ncbi:MAG: hypothetical protein RL684_135 [Pseudomonadota bacterium]|jgi:thiopurine S-methyltransferase